MPYPSNASLGVIGLNFIEPRTFAEIMALEDVPDGTVVYATDWETVQVYCASTGAWLTLAGAPPIEHLADPPPIEKTPPDTEESSDEPRKPGRNLLL